MQRSKKVLSLTLILALNVLVFKHNIVKAHTALKKSPSTIVRSASVKTNTTKRASRGGSYEDAYARSRSLVSYAYNFIGKPYVWGAEGSSSFDCSGLTLYVYKSLGIKLPHYTGSQANLGKNVNRSELMPGDLVFFNTSGYISHVGIYVGSDEFIHASSGSGKVIKSNLGQSYYNSRYVKARRIVE